MEYNLGKMLLGSGAAFATLPLPTFSNVVSARGGGGYRFGRSVVSKSLTEPRRSRRRRQSKKIVRESDRKMSARKAHRRGQMVSAGRAHIVDGIDIRDDVYLNSHARQMRALKLAQLGQTLSELRARSRYNPAGMVT